MTKVKHASGVYKNMLSAPTPEDLLFWLKDKKKKSFTMTQVVQFFGEQKQDIIDITISKLIEEEVLVYDSINDKYLLVKDEY